MIRTLRSPRERIFVRLNNARLAAYERVRQQWSPSIFSTPPSSNTGEGQ